MQLSPKAVKAMSTDLRIALSDADRRGHPDEKGNRLRLAQLREQLSAIESRPTFHPLKPRDLGHQYDSIMRQMEQLSAWLELPDKALAARDRLKALGADALVEALWEMKRSGLLRI